MGDQGGASGRPRFEDQVVVVTGAGRGIGRDHALLLASEGARVVVNDHGGDTEGQGASIEPARAVVAEIQAAGGVAVVDSHDVATDAEAIIQTALDAFGDLHGVVNNAGVANGGQLDEISTEDFDRLLAVHVGGTVGVCRAAWPILRDRGYGRIVNTSSCSVFGLPMSSAYVTAKSAVFGLTRALAQDGRGCGIVVNSVMPTAYSRLTARSPEFAAVMQAGFPSRLVSPFVAALLSRDVSVSGECFVVGGGRAARVVLATGKGLRNITTVEDCLAGFAEAMTIDDMVVPPDAVHEVIYEAEQIGLDLASLTVPAGRL